jgi:transcriptional regulator with XRE-family HTH domain
MTYSETIVFRIKSICEQRNLSYYKLSEMSGLNLSTIDNIIRGETKNPRIMTLHKIAIGLNMTLGEFVNYKELNEFSFDE